MSWWNSLLSAVGLASSESAPDYDQVHWLDFTLGRGFPLPLPASTERLARALPEQLLPGFSLVGQFSFFKTGQVQVAHQEGAFDRPLERYPGFKAMVFVPVSNTLDEGELWTRIAERLEDVYRGALAACLGDESRNGDPEDSAVGYLPHLKADAAAGRLDADGLAYLANLETVALFQECSWRSEDAPRLSVRDLLAATSVTLVTADQGARLKRRQALDDLVFLLDSRESRRIVAAYGLSGDCERSARMIWEATHPALTETERSQAALLLDGQATRARDVVSFPCSDQTLLVIDLRQRIVKSTDGHGATLVEMSFNSLTRLDLDEQLSPEGRWAFTLLLSDGTRSLIYQQVYETEGVRLLHAICAAIAFDGSRILRDDLTPEESLFDLVPET